MNTLSQIWQLSNGEDGEVPTVVWLYWRHLLINISDKPPSNDTASPSFNDETSMHDKAKGISMVVFRVFLSGCSIRYLDMLRKPWEKELNGNFGLCRFEWNRQYHSSPYYILSTHKRRWALHLRKFHIHVFLRWNHQNIIPILYLNSDTISLNNFYMFNPVLGG